MDEQRMRELWKQANDNRNALDACKLHYFTCPAEVGFGTRLKCRHCGGSMDAVAAYQYARGYEAHGGKGGDVIEGWDADVDESSQTELPLSAQERHEDDVRRYLGGREGGKLELSTASLAAASHEDMCKDMRKLAAARPLELKPLQGTFVTHCRDALRGYGKPYPAVCDKCGLGPCKGE
jgi:hypothetical protein